MKVTKVNLASSFEKVAGFWAPVVAGDIGSFQVKLAKFQGDFHWHHHETEDELFLVVRGRLLIKLRDEDGGDLIVEQGEFAIVPKGVQHCPVALTDEVHCVLLEPGTTLNTGNVVSDRTLHVLKRL